MLTQAPAQLHNRAHSGDNQTKTFGFILLVLTMEMLIIHQCNKRENRVIN